MPEGIGYKGSERSKKVKRKINFKKPIDVSLEGETEAPSHMSKKVKVKKKKK